MTPRPIVFHVLVIAEDRAVIAFLDGALAEGPISHRTTHFRDGPLAHDFLARLEDPEAPAESKPDLVCLDLNAPDLGGVLFLTRLKNHPLLKTVPVVVLPAVARGDNQGPAVHLLFRDQIKTLYHAWRRTAQGANA